MAKDLTDLEKTLNMIHGTEGLSVNEFVDYLDEISEGNKEFFKKEVKDLLFTLSQNV